MNQLPLLVSSNTFGEWLETINNLIYENNNATAFGRANSLVRYDQNGTLDMGQLTLGDLVIEGDVSFPYLQFNGNSINTIATDFSSINDHTILTANAIQNYIESRFDGLIGNATSAYDTLVELENHLRSSNNEIIDILSELSNKVDAPTIVTTENEFLQWDGTTFVAGSPSNTLDQTQVEDLILESSGFGERGQVNIITESGTRKAVPNWLIFEGNFANTSEDLTNALSSGSTLQNILNSWSTFSHINNTTNQPANTEADNAFIYNPTENSIECIINSNAHIGFYSPAKYDNFEFDVKLTSTDSDNDRMAIVIAFAIDDVGHEHTLTAIRNHDNPKFTWRIVYNYLQGTNGNEKVILDASSLVPLEGGWQAWRNFPNGIRIKVRRDFDSITAITTQDNQTSFDPATELNFLLTDDPLLEIFRGPKPYGISCYSQGAIFSDIKFTDYGINSAENYVFDLVNNKVYTPENDGTFAEDASKNLLDEIGTGRILRDKLTNVLWYINKDSSLVQLTSGDKKFKIGDGPEINSISTDFSSANNNTLVTSQAVYDLLTGNSSISLPIEADSFGFDDGSGVTVNSIATDFSSISDSSLVTSNAVYNLLTDGTNTLNLAATSIKIGGQKIDTIATSIISPYINDNTVATTKAIYGLIDGSLGSIETIKSNNITLSNQTVNSIVTVVDSANSNDYSIATVKSIIDLLTGNSSYTIDLSGPSITIGEITANTIATTIDLPNTNQYTLGTTQAIVDLISGSTGSNILYSVNTSTLVLGGGSIDKIAKDFNVANTNHTSIPTTLAVIDLLNGDATTPLTINPSSLTVGNITITTISNDYSVDNNNTLLTANAVHQRFSDLIGDAPVAFQTLGDLYDYTDSIFQTVSNFPASYAELNGSSSEDFYANTFYSNNIVIGSSPNFVTIGEDGITINGNTVATAVELENLSNTVNNLTITTRGEIVASISPGISQSVTLASQTMTGYDTALNTDVGSSVWCYPITLAVSCRADAGSSVTITQPSTGESVTATSFTIQSKSFTLSDASDFLIVTSTGSSPYRTYYIDSISFNYISSIVASGTTASISANDPVISIPNYAYVGVVPDIAENLNNQIGVDKWVYPLTIAGSVTKDPYLPQFAFSGCSNLGTINWTGTYASFSGVVLADNTEVLAYAFSSRVAGNAITITNIGYTRV